jgi:hypothetical protein
MNGQSRIIRQVTTDQEKLLKILDAVKYATIENIKIKDCQIRRIEVRLIYDLDSPEEFKKSLDELRTIVL